ncbi:terminase [Enterococcus hirae]|uniref:terminase n=1 Tax=Enterococcus hirae TaxID=1354 RepID=UPI00136CB7BB|nr:terminase [Enterococcus hirae]NAE18043.1 terminase [Enterococcus hirae]
MPRRLVQAAEHDRSRSLGWLGLAWLEHLVVHGPGDVQGEPVSHGDEYSEFIADCYALDEDGRLLYDSAFLSRPKGCDKSGLGARFALLEAIAPVRFAGWAEGGEQYRFLDFVYEYEPGEPMGQPVKVPYIRLMATEEGQTGNVYDTVHFNFTDGPLAATPGIQAGLTRILLPGGGEITPSTASSSSKDGGKETFVCFDETHLYNTPELRQMYKTVTRNLRKRKKIAQTWYLETTTMFGPGQDSIAEQTYKQAELIAEGKVKRQRLLYDHRWGEIEDLTDEAALRAALTDSYGDALAWNHLDGLVDEFMDLRSVTSDSRRYFLNAPTSAEDAWLAHHEWAACVDVEKVVADRDVITLGFDGSRTRARGVTDATALIGCRISDGYVFEIATWEQPPNWPREQNWQVPVADVDAVVRGAFAKYSVAAFYADPAKWESYIASWEAAFGGSLQKKSSREHPIEWWMTGGRAASTVKALELFSNAVLEREMTHDGSTALTRHVLNARRRVSRSGTQIAKADPDSPHKIDAAVAAVLAWQARIDCIAAGIGKAPTRRYAARRLY